MGLIDNAVTVVWVALVVLSGATAFFTFSLAVYRVYLTNLTGFPGVWLAKATRLYELYHDYYHHGTYPQMIEEMHEKFGKVIRISPKTLHIADASFYKELLLGPRPFTWPAHPEEDIPISRYELRRVPTTVITNTCVHGARLNPVEPLIVQKLAGFIAALETVQANEMGIKMHLEFFNLAAGILKACYLQPSTPRANVHDSERGPEHSPSVSFPWYIHVITSFFRRVMRKIKVVKTAFSSDIPSDRKILRDMFKNIGNDPVNIEGWANTSLQFRLRGPSREALRPPAYRLMSDKDLVLDMSIRLARALTVLFNYLFYESGRLNLLRAELMGTVPGHTPEPLLNELLSLPYLTCCVREALRMSNAMDNCIIRMTRFDRWTYYDGRVSWRVPAGTTVRISAKMVFSDPDLFPDAYAFRPERWLTTPGLKDLFDPFTTGMEVTWATMLLTATSLFRSYTTVNTELESCIGWFDLHVNDFNAPDRQLYGYGGIPLVGPDETSLWHQIRPRRPQGRPRESLDLATL